MTRQLVEALRRSLASSRRVLGPGGPVRNGSDDDDDEEDEEPFETPPQERPERPDPEAPAAA